MDVLSGVVGLALGVALGWWLASRKQPNIEAMRAEHEAYRGDVEKHFEKSAQLAHQMAEDYRQLYNHLAQSSVALCGDQDQHSTPSLAAMRRYVEQKDADASPESVPGAKPISPTAD